MSARDFDGSHEIVRLIRGWIEGHPPPTEQTRLIRIAAEIVLARLRSRLTAASRIQEFDHPQLALWAVTELFASGPGPDSTLAKSWSSATPPDSPTAIIGWFESRVVQCAKHELQRLIAENDPYEYKLRRRIFRALRHHSALALFPDRAPEYVCLKGETELNPHLPRVSLGEIRKVTGSGQAGEAELQELLFEIVSSLSQRSDRCRAIPLWALYESVGEYELSHALVEFKQRTSDRCSSDQELAAEVQEATAKSLEGINSLLAKYLRLRRLTQNEVDRMRTGVETYLRHFALQGDGVHLPSCLQDNWPGLTGEMYKTKYAKVFEYVTSLARAKFMAYWQHDEKNLGKSTVDSL